MPDAPHAHPLDGLAPEVPLASEALLKRMKSYGVALAALGLLCFACAAWLSHLTDQLTAQRIAWVRSTQSLLLQELSQLNAEPSAPPQPKALKQLIELGESVSSQNAHWLWLGHLYQQKLQYYLTQAIEALSRPISGLDSTLENRLQRERAIRIEAQPRLQALEDQLQTADNGYVKLLLILGALFAIPGCIMWGQLVFHRHNNTWIRRTNTLGLALRTQSEADQTRLGATLALEGVLAAIENTRNTEHRHALMQLGGQLEELKRSGQKTLEFAHAFHNLSTQATSLAKVALTQDQRNARADSDIERVHAHLEGLRLDMRAAAQGLRRAGEVSRHVLAQLQGDTPPEDLQTLVEQGQHALKDAIEGMVMAGQKINQGQDETRKLAAHLSVSHGAWANLLEQIEQYADSASTQSEQALNLAKHLIQTTKIQAEQPGALTAPPQAAKAPPQLLP